ncbi:hypothetical protein ACSHWB_34455 [Lentzea sp. HUAS TT2]|uniref:hypothetical protein n=1 Tax=Lentzea sp. HUAS TT2 TaxID=3447454 RepID=UPI003F71A3E4
MIDEDALRKSAWLVVEHLPVDTTAQMVSRYGGAEELVDSMVKRGVQAGRRLARAGREPMLDEYSIFAVSLLSMKRGYEGVQENPTNVIKEFDQLRSFGDVPLTVAVRSRLVRGKDLVPLLAATSRLVHETRSEVLPDELTTMVAAAVVTRQGPDAAADVVTSVLARGAELAGRRPQHAHQSGVDDRYPSVANVDFACQIAAYRAALDEFDGTPATDALVASHTAEVTRVLHEAMTTPRGRREPDVLRAFDTFAQFLGGDDTAVKIFSHLQTDLFSARAPRFREVPVDHDDSAFVRLDSEDAAALTLAVDEVAHRIHDELCLGTSPAEREALVRWLAGAHRADSQDNLLFLLDRVRRVDRGVRVEPPSVTVPRHPVLARVVRSRVTDALRLGLTGGTLLQAVLPPLWTNRNAAVLFVASKLRVRIGRGFTRPAKPNLVASVVVRAPAQQVHRAADQDRPETCCCVTEHGRRAPEPTLVCPHRLWSEGGRVEDYTTLTAITGYPSDDATRMHLRRYQGPWDHWVADALEP